MSSLEQKIKEASKKHIQDGGEKKLASKAPVQRQIESEIDLNEYHRVLFENAKLKNKESVDRISSVIETLHLNNKEKFDKIKIENEITDFLVANEQQKAPFGKYMIGMAKMYADIEHKNKELESKYEDLQKSLKDISDEYQKGMWKMEQSHGSGKGKRKRDEDVDEYDIKHSYGEVGKRKKENPPIDNKTIDALQNSGFRDLFNSIRNMGLRRGELQV